MKNLVIAIVCALSMSACVIEEGEEGETEESYSNHVKLECNGSVLVDRTFTSKSECETFRSENTFTCSGLTLSISC